MSFCEDDIYVAYLQQITLYSLIRGVNFGAGFTPVGNNTPKSRLGRSFRFAKRKASLNEIHHDSMR
jgi:hypothetical protein